MIKVLNLKESIFPDVAVCELEKEIDLSKLSEINVIIAIHGYGSHGKGGEIKKEVNKSLRMLKNKHQIIDYIKGEQWSEVNEKYFELTKLEPELILHPHLNNLNSGVTLIWIKK